MNMKTLVIVESPNKKSTIEKYLGEGFRVEASIGHINDLCLKNMGVDVSNSFKPAYELSERGKKVVSKLLPLAQKAESVILATDLDREGEAIAYHLKNELKLTNYKRVTFNEITKEAIQKAMSNLRDIDIDLVRAQEARRVLDRLIGFKVSPMLSNASANKKTLSAGRVQTPAVKIVVDREKAIRNFVPTDHFSARLTFSNNEDSWFADWDTSPFTSEANPYILDEEMAERAIVSDEYKIVDIVKKAAKKNPPAPFITTTLQKAGILQFGLTADNVMSAAQLLFEKGLITYHRTDNPNLSSESYEAVCLCLQDEGFKHIEKQRVWNAKDNSQEAHEAIRPSNFNIKEADTGNKNADEIYQLIRARALASQMLPTIHDKTTIYIAGDSNSLAPNAQFKAVGMTLVDEGWKSLTSGDYAEEASANTASQTLPKNLSVGEELNLIGKDIIEKKTKKPKRFAEHSLIDELERQGIGRPSTYAAIMSNIKTREYLLPEGKFFKPSETAFDIIGALEGKFKFLDLDYTRNIEEDLDLIARSKAIYSSIVSDVFDSLEKSIGKCGQLVIGKQIKCQKCDGNMVLKGKGTNQFYGCTNYKDGCRFTMISKKGVAVNHVKKECPKCKGALWRKRRSDKKGYFWHCDDRQSCGYITNDDNGKPAEKPPCPKNGCSGYLIKRPSKGKGYWWGCSEFKNGCKHTSKA